MRIQFVVIVAFFLVLSYFGAQGAIGSYDYCGKPCNEPSGIVCAYNQHCFTYFTNMCEMRKRNCDHDDRFLKAEFMSCFIGSKCRGI